MEKRKKKKKRNIGFARDIGLFIVVALLLLVVVNEAYIYTVEYKKVAYLQQESYSQYLSDMAGGVLDLAFVGDSHVKNDINPRFIPGSINFGLGAENYVHSYYRIKRILDSGVDIDTLVLEIDLHTFSSVLSDEDNMRSNLHLYSEFIPYRDMVELGCGSPLSVFVGSNFPVVGNGKEADILFDPPVPKEIYLGWVNRKGDFSFVKKRAASAEKKFDIFFRNRTMISDLSLDYFEKLLVLAKDNDIDVVLVKYPVTRAYDSVLVSHGVEKEDYYENIFRVVDSVLDDYLLLDYYDVFFDLPEYFSNPDHLNEVGAQRFSEMVYADITGDEDQV